MIREEAQEYIEELRETVQLDVRGKRYMTTKKTLQKGGESSMLSALASGRWKAETAEGKMSCIVHKQQTNDKEQGTL